MMNSDAIDIRFDTDGRIRVLSSQSYEHFHSMVKECDEFISSKSVKSPYDYLHHVHNYKILHADDLLIMIDIDKFKQKSDHMIGCLQNILTAVDHEKVLTVSQRNVVENESQARKQKSDLLQMLLNQKEKELNRIHDQCENMKSVLCKQEKEMEKIRRF